MGRAFTLKLQNTLRLAFFALVLAAAGGACVLPGSVPGITNPSTPTITPLINLSGVESSETPVLPTASVASSPTEILTSTPAPTIIPQATPEAFSLWIAPYLPPGLTAGLVTPFPLSLAAEPTMANLMLDIGGDNVVTRLVYVLAAPFPSLEEEASVVDLMQSWKVAPQGKFQSGHLYLSEATYVIFTRWWGPPAGDFVRILAEDQLLDSVWRDRNAWALLPFEGLEPRWKAIAVDGDNPIWKSFDPVSYTLSVPVSVSGANPAAAQSLADAFRMTLPGVLNRDSEKLTTVILTGVTALVRATAAEMETRGIVYPALDVGDMFREADILHISNEIPFSASCPEPNPTSPSLVFCSSPDYMLLLETIGTDVIELTGDHFGDWGSQAVLYTLDLYDQAGIHYYGGGETVEEAQAPLIIEHNGNQIAFVGCNAKGGNYTPLLNGWPGAVDCRFNDVIPLLNQLDLDGYTTIMTFQHFEYYYFNPSYVLENDFRLVADAGADIVSGSQAHQPHGMEFYRGSTLFYGLGNLFFDQLDFSEDTARAFITRSVIYDNRYISSEIITIYFSDYSRPRLMFGDPRNSLLRAVFGASEWGDMVFNN